MQRSRSLAAALAALLCAGLVSCAHAGSSPPAAAAAHQLEGDLGLLEPFRSISPREPVPHFVLMDTAGAVHDSRELVGRGPLLISFFASWCESCALKTPMLKRSLEQAPSGTQSLWISLDDASTWPNVSEYIEAHQIRFPVVRGAEFAKFALAYDPMQAVPAVVVVDLAGYVVDFQVGVRASDAERLTSALQLAATRRPTSGSLTLGLPTTPAPRAPLSSGGVIFEPFAAVFGGVVFDQLAARAVAQAVD